MIKEKRRKQTGAGKRGIKMGILKQAAAALTAAAMLLCSAAVLPVSAADTVIYSSLIGLPFANGDPFKGVDVSSVISLEKSGVKFRGRSGKEQDIFRTLADAGVNTVRVRIWNDPYETGTHANYGGGICDITVAEQIAKRCANAGLRLFVDFHYSDFWADPGKQKAPKAWKDYSVAQKAEAIHSFTLASLKRLAETGAEIAMVQIGNETTTGMCGVMLADYNWSDAGWSDLCTLFNAGAGAVREFNPDTLVALHFTNPEKSDNMAYLAKMVAQNHVDYDVFATSYYPYWHGTLSNLTRVLTGIIRWMMPIILPIRSGAAIKWGSMSPTTSARTARQPFCMICSRRLPLFRTETASAFSTGNLHGCRSARIMTRTAESGKKTAPAGLRVLPENMTIPQNSITAEAVWKMRHCSVKTAHRSAHFMCSAPFTETAAHSQPQMKTICCKMQDLRQTADGLTDRRAGG